MGIHGYVLSIASASNSNFFSESVSEAKWLSNQRRIVRTDFNKVAFKGSDTIEPERFSCVCDQFKFIDGI